MNNDSNDLSDPRNDSGHAGVYTVRGIRIPTRYFLAPVNTGFFAHGLPTEGLKQFHQDRSGRSIGVSYVGNVAVAEEYATSPTTAFLSPHWTWEVIANAIATNGSIPGIQLACKSLPEAAPKKWINKDVGRFVQHLRSHLMSLSTGTLDRAFDRFVWAADAAWRLGFRVIQLHAAHGYFLSLLLSQEINRRTDRYGDGPEAIRQLILAIRSLGHPMVLDIRLSLSEGIRHRTEELETFALRLTRIANMEVDIISLSDGFYDLNKFRIYPQLKEGLGCHIGTATSYAIRFPAKLWNIAGNIWDITALAPQLLPNLSLSIGRSLIADPAFVEKSLRLNAEPINTCVRAGHCHYYSRGRPHIECKVNSNVAGDERYHLPIVRSEERANT